MGAMHVGKSRDKIAQELQISIGAVSGIIKDFGCKPKDGKCPEGWGMNEDGQYFPARKKYPKGYWRADDDEQVLVFQNKKNQQYYLRPLMKNHLIYATALLTIAIFGLCIIPLETIITVLASMEWNDQ